MKLFAVGVTAAVILLAAVRPSSAGIIFTTFGPGNTYDQNSGDLIGNDFGGDDLAEADSFTVGAGTSYTLDSITIALGDFNDGGATATVSLRTNSGNLPGSIIESINTGSLPNFGDSNDSPVTVNAVMNDVLQAGTTYWVVVTTNAANTVEWNHNSMSLSGTIAQSLDGGSTWNAVSSHPLGAFSVQATPENSVVPEPATLVLFGLGLAGLIGFRRKLS